MLTGLRVLGRHGALPGERDRPQPFVVDVELEIDLDAAARSDDLADTIHYGEVAQLVAGETATHSFALLERLAGHLADVLLDRHPRLQGTRVVVHKPRAAVDADVADVLVDLRRERS